MYLPCNTSQYIIKVLGCITGCIGMYSQMYWDVFGEVFWFMCRLGIHPNTADNTSQYIVEYIIIPLKYMYYKMCCDTGIYCKMYCGTSQHICQYMTIHRRIHHNTSKIIHVLQDVAWPTWPVHGGKSLVGLGQSSADWPVCYVSLQCHCRIIVVHLNTSVSTSQYIVEYIIIPLK